MKKLLPLLLLLPGLAFGASAVRQSAINTTAPGSSSVTTTALASTTVTGDTIDIAIDAGSSATACSATDLAGDTFAAPTLGSGTNPVHDMSNGAYFWVLQAVNVTGHASLTASITCNDTINAWEVDDLSGVPTSSPIDVSASVFSGTSPANVPVTTTASGELVLSYGSSAGGSSRAVAPTGTGFTQQNTYVSAIITLTSATLPSASTGAHDPTWTRTGGSIAAFTIAYKSSGGGATCTHAGFTASGALTVPTAGSTSVNVPSEGKFDTVDCSTKPYQQPTNGGALGVASLLPRGVNLASFAHN